MKKKNIVLYVTILLVGIIISGFFLPFHTVPDTYNVLQQKQEYCTTFIKDGRIFSALFLFLGIKLNIPITLLCIVSNIIALLANCTSVYIIFKTIECKENNYWKNVIMLMGSFLLVFNQFAMEHLAYFETGIICIGKLLSIIAAKKLIINNVKIKSIGILILSVFCYQGILNVFVLNAIIFSIVKDKKIKKMSKSTNNYSEICDTMERRNTEIQMKREKTTNDTKTKYINKNRYCSASCLCLLHLVGKCDSGDQDRLSSDAGRLRRYCEPDCFCGSSFYAGRDSGVDLCFH